MNDDTYLKVLYISKIKIKIRIHTKEKKKKKKKKAMNGQEVMTILRQVGVLLIEFRISGSDWK